jgi:hypothetical protein
MNFLDFKSKYCKETPNMIFLPPKIQGWNSESVALKKAIEQESSIRRLIFYFRLAYTIAFAFSGN